MNIVALDQEFIENYVDYSIDNPSTPYSIEENPCYGADCGAGCGKKGTPAS